MSHRHNFNWILSYSIMQSWGSQKGTVNIKNIKDELNPPMYKIAIIEVMALKALLAHLQDWRYGTLWAPSCTVTCHSCTSPRVVPTVRAPSRTRTIQEQAKCPPNSARNRYTISKLPPPQESFVIYCIQEKHQIKYILISTNEKSKWKSIHIPHPG